MPPFGDEPAEPTPKPLSFLTLRNASAKRRPVQNRAFGAEPAEASDAGGLGGQQQYRPGAALPKSRPKRPFEDEGDEGVSTSAKPGKEVKHQCTPVPFCDEGDESDLGGDDGFQSSDDEDNFVPQQNTVFSFGWASVSTLKKASFWKEQIDDENAKKPKRVYDNSKRAAEAAYTRKKTAGVYKRNGLDPARLQKLFAATRCGCARVGIQYVFSGFGFSSYGHLLQHHGFSIYYRYMVAKQLHENLGAKRNCFEQFRGRGSKELPYFLEKNWALSKQDQDSLASCNKFGIFY